MSRIVFLGNFNVDFSSETHHKKSLEALGHEVIPMQETVAGSDLILAESLKSDAFVWVHTHGWQTPGVLSMEVVLQQLKAAGIPTITYHLDLWLGLSREKDLDVDPVYKHIQHFFTVDKQMADWFNDNTSVKGHYLPAGVFHKETYMAKSRGYKYDVVFVGSKRYHPEWQYRPQLITFLQSVYKNRFYHFGNDSARGVIRGDRLNQLYADSKIVIGDSLCKNFDYPYYWSDRVYETTGRGGFIIHPNIEGLETQFKLMKEPHDEVELVTYNYGDFQRLQALIDHYLGHPQEREAIRKRGFERTKKDHTYLQRWSHILKEVGL